MLELAKNYEKGPISMSDISNNQNIPVKYLEQLIIPLKKGNLVISVRGPKGGHMLSRSPEKINVWEVLTLLESKLFIVDCLGNENVCENSRDCLIRPIWREAFQSMVDIFKDNNLKDILEISEN